MDFVLILKLVTASMAGQVLIVLKLSVIHHVLMVLLWNQISVSVMKAGKVVFVIFLLALMDVEMEIVLIVKCVNASLAGTAPLLKLPAMQSIVLKLILDAGIVRKIFHSIAKSVSPTML